MSANLDKVVGKTIESVSLNDTRDEVRFVFGDGTIKRYGVEGDCCSESWIEHLTVPDDISGSTILSVEESDGVEASDEQYAESKSKRGEADCLQVYSTRFRTNRGDIVLEYRNDSNGYYGGSLVELRK
jgi:hypothetical protein